MINRIVYVLIALMIIGCKHISPNVSLALDTNYDKNVYLESLFNEDQANRGDEGYDIIIKYGKNSEQYKKHIEEFITRDSLIFEKLKKYLLEYGYPNRVEEFSEIGLGSFVYITGHQGNLKKQMRVFPILSEAFYEGKMSEDDFSHLLGEMYEAKFGGQNFVMNKNRFTASEEIKSLLIALDLDPQKDNNIYDKSLLIDEVKD